ncbi:hypothetical protein TNCV_2491351 [Trichonephila clavipes]|nr:hypothetical protein TNCV_2491351 [Trichonephila clavipes]
MRDIRRDPPAPRERRSRPLETLEKRNSLRGYDEEESNDKKYNRKYDYITEIDLDLEEGDTVENKCLICRDTKTFGKNCTSRERYVGDGGLKRTELNLEANRGTRGAFDAKRMRHLNAQLGIRAMTSSAYNP